MGLGIRGEEKKLVGFLGCSKRAFDKCQLILAAVSPEKPEKHITGAEGFLALLNPGMNLNVETRYIASLQGF